VASRLVNALGTGTAPARWLLASVGFVLGVGVNALLSIAVLTGLTRLWMPLRRVLGPALLVAAGLELLKTLGRLYVERTEANPTYQVVAGAVGLLVFLNIVNQLVLFAATLTATGTAGHVTDLAARATRHPPTATPFIRPPGSGPAQATTASGGGSAQPADQVSDAGVEHADDGQRRREQRRGHP